MSRARGFTVAAAVLTGVVLLAGAVFTALAPTASSFASLAVALLAAPLAAALGVLVVRRRPENVVGLHLALVGLGVAFVATRDIGWRVLARRPDTAASLDWLAAVLNESAAWAFVAVALLVLHFPDGRLPSLRWRLIPPVLAAAAAAVQLRGSFDNGPFRPPLEDLPQPFGPPPGWVDLLGFVGFVLLVALMAASAVSPVVRLRRGDRLVRAQIKWLALAGCGVLLYIPICLVEIAIWGEPSWVSLGVVVAAVVGVPVAVAVAVLWHDVYDVDKALAASVLWLVVSVVVVGIYGLSSLATGVVLGRASPAGATAATVVAAVALAPLRVRLQRRVDRRLYPLRRAALAAVEALYRDASAGRARPEALQAVLRDALRDPRLRVGYQVPGTETFVDADGDAVDPERGSPVTLGGSRIGVLAPGDGVASAELLRQIADASATVVEVVRLRLELNGALREVESSRARLLHVGYQERSRLERDLHDGAQQRLVSLGMSLRLAQRHLGDGTVDVDGLLDETVAELGIAVAELRQIAHGLRPSALDDGLPAAVAGLVRTVPVAVDLDVCAEPLPDDIATTAYYVVSEAMANAVKHAEATHISLRVARINGLVVVRVSDDGRGGARIDATSTLADRVAALRGTLHVDSPVGRGTVIEAALPCGS